MKKEIEQHLEVNFSEFEKDLREEILSCAKLEFLEADTLMMDIGQKVEIIPLIVQGQVKVYREDENDHELFMYYLGPGEACAITMICSARDGYSKIKAIPEEETIVIAVPIAKLDEWMPKYKSWYYFVMDTYQDRFEELLKVVDGIAFHQMDERLLEYLEKNAAATQSNVIHRTHQQIAQELNSSREVITRLLKKLEQRGRVKVNRNQIELVN
ncbi:Crp/Fnr family transcriptional regulator [Algoriphagus sanaruensis]|uniref:Crp/Fnr family transcriptional regulator n=1 Tax=Algoriphagus sanaruensis TaxID=1727163 RepID=A0A142EMH9_9BACT|nr:Crp/Fnr family transcriptional regulator [Algoriphagus sanaruensis]AMQ56334.1 Crp/Fnr family transcriptional regulator [Algoriphagus sanaruensis]